MYLCRFCCVAPEENLRCNLNLLHVEICLIHTAFEQNSRGTCFLKPQRLLWIISLICIQKDPAKARWQWDRIYPLLFSCRKYYFWQKQLFTAIIFNTYTPGPQLHNCWWGERIVLCKRLRGADLVPAHHVGFTPLLSAPWQSVMLRVKDWPDHSQVTSV